MPLDSANTRKHLASFAFKQLFIEELGWDRHDSRLPILANGQSFSLSAIAQKRGMTAFVCPAGADGRIPDYPTRLKIERQVGKSAHEHLIIFVDAQQSVQIWQWVRREHGKPAACREHPYHSGQPGDSLIQKLQTLAISLEEEESLTLPDVTAKARRAFDIERVTKRFYDRFKAEHAAFLDFLEGIPDEEMERWYASVMLNRLMFIYFIQKKGFLNSDQDYLKNKLVECRKQMGKDHYYRDFLCPLFFEGFAQKKEDRSSITGKLLGEVPYLNGGIFMPHQIEQLHGKTIEIADTAFQKLFEFFDAYQWHLDERPLRKDNEINPDVLGYIFEKYINQKQMGAYYTKEDITEYISKNTVIPYIFDAAREECKVAFENPNGPTVWDLLRDDPDRYIYPAVRYGVDRPLPSDVAGGIDTTQPNLIARRKAWNKPAEPEYALPTETWREVVARRTRYNEVRRKLVTGDICDINDLITLNLDIRQFAQDALASCESPDFLRAFWHAINKITILDPTCGSGAFLFAALNILEPLYEGCLDRMKAFFDDLERLEEKHRSEKFSDFHKVLKRVQAHPNRRYFIFKSIILNNLFGVDIMEEAVEICKLRLFLKLVAQVEPDTKRINFGIEPLPDIDFNIRSGNTLVGFATYDDVKHAVTSKLDFDDVMEKISGKAADLQQAFDAFRQRQVEGDGSVPAEQKHELRKDLTALQNELSRYLASEYGIKLTRKDAYATWLSSHRPFHWFVEFYGILSNGGFDVIIGNPPYVEIRNLSYSVREFQTVQCADLYALCMERSRNLLIAAGRLGMIVPVSIVSTDGFSTLRRCLHGPDTMSWTLNFADRPSKLFSGVEKRLTIWLMERRGDKIAQLHLSNYKRWIAEERGALFSKNQFVMHTPACSIVGDSIPKVCTSIETRILERISDDNPLEMYLVGSSKSVVRYTRKLRYFVQFFDFVPCIQDSKGRKIEPSELKELHSRDESQKDVIISVLNSSLFFWFFCVFSDVRNVNKREVNSFRCSLDRMTPEIVSGLRSLCRVLMKDFDRNSRMLTSDYGSRGVLHIQSFQPRLSKPIIDDIDRVLAQHYGFTEDELDFIINYDIKYRMGPEVENDVGKDYEIRQGPGQAAKAAEDPE